MEKEFNLKQIYREQENTKTSVEKNYAKRRTYEVFDLRPKERPTRSTKRDRFGG